MKDLVVGDKVLTANGKYETIFTLHHFHRSKTSNFLQIYTDSLEGERPIEMSPDHLIFTDRMDYPVPASRVKVGDLIMTAWNGLKEVTRIKSITRDGFFSPLTSGGDGTIVVDGIVASTYTSLTGNSHIETTNGMKLMSFHAMMDISSAPYRAFCSSNGKLNIWSSNWCGNYQEREGRRSNERNESDSGSATLLRDSMRDFFYIWSERNHVIQFMIFVIYLSTFGAVATSLHWMNTLVLMAAVLSIRYSHYVVRKKV